MEAFLPLQRMPIVLVVPVGLADRFEIDPVCPQLDVSSRGALARMSTTNVLNRMLCSLVADDFDSDAVAESLQPAGDTVHARCTWRVGRVYTLNFETPQHLRTRLLERPNLPRRLTLLQVQSLCLFDGKLSGATAINEKTKSTDSPATPNMFESGAYKVFHTTSRRRYHVEVSCAGECPL